MMLLTGALSRKDIETTGEAVSINPTGLHDSSTVKKKTEQSSLYKKMEKFKQLKQKKKKSAKWNL